MLLIEIPLVTRDRRLVLTLSDERKRLGADVRHGGLVRIVACVDEFETVIYDGVVVYEFAPRGANSLLRVIVNLLEEETKRKGERSRRTDVASEMAERVFKEKKRKTRVIPRQRV